jgi:hypothetical protein
MVFMVSKKVNALFGLVSGRHDANVAPDPSEFAPDPLECAPDPLEFAPDPSELAPDPLEFAPDLSEFAPDHSEFAPDPLEFAPDPSEFAPDLSEFASDPLEFAPDLSEFAPDPSYSPSMLSKGICTMSVKEPQYKIAVQLHTADMKCTKHPLFSTKGPFGQHERQMPQANLSHWRIASSVLSRKLSPMVTSPSLW